MSDPRPQIEIREMTIEDIAPVYALGERLFTADRWTNLYRTWDEHEVINNYVSDPETSLVADLDDEVVGFALGTMIDKRRSAWMYGYVLWFGVDPTRRGFGIGERLLKRLTETFIRDGARMLLVDTDAENEGAIRFFQRHGFGNLQDHVYMSKNLTKHPAYEKLREQEREEERRRASAREPRGVKAVKPARKGT